MTNGRLGGGGSPLKRWLVLALVAAALLSFYWLVARLQGDEIHIAYAGPLSGPSGADSKAVIAAVELYFDQINRQGGISGKKLVLHRFDDGNDPAKARQVARQIAGDERFIAIIGHNSSSCSISAGPIYAEAGIPAVSFSATNNAVTRGNDWYFRTIYNDDFQGQFLANYIHKVFAGRPVVIASDRGQYGVDLAQIFVRTAREIGLEVGGHYRFGPADSSLAAAAVQMEAAADSSLFFVAAGPATGARLIRLLRDRGVDNQIVGPDAFATAAFRDIFAKLSGGAAQPGFYSEGIYLAVPLLFDTANRRAQGFRQDYLDEYGVAPNWWAAYAYDTAALIGVALERGGAAGRGPLQQALAAIESPLSGVEGVTGNNYFDPHGDALKTAAMGVYHRGHLVSALTQFQVVGDPELLSRTDPSFAIERMIAAGSHYLYQTDVVLAGLRADSFSAFNPGDLSFEIDLNLWFRYKGALEVGHIQFLNAWEPLQLGEPAVETVEGGVTYRLYRLKGRFKADFIAPSYGRHILGLSFRHRDLTRNNLIFAIDSEGMEWGESDELARLRALEPILDPQLKWTITQGLFFQDIAQEHPLGHPRYMATETGLEYSRFNIAIEVKKNELTLRGLLPPQYAGTLILLGLAATVGLVLAISSAAFKRFPKTTWAGQAGAALVLLLACETFFGVHWAEGMGLYRLSLMERAFDILWWAVPAFLVDLAVSRFFWEPLEASTGRTVPTLLRRFVSCAIYLLAFFGIVAFVFDRKLTGLLATSGVIAMIIGLAVQINISNIFSGIAINLERPFHIGDWIMVHGRTPTPELNTIGRVVDINWRATRLVTTENSMVVIPNSVIAERILTNFMSPDEVSRFELLFWIDPSTPAQKVIEAMMAGLEAVADQEGGGPLREPKYKARVNRTTELGVEYQVRYYIIPRLISPAKGRHIVSQSILAHLEQAGIAPAYPRRNIDYRHLPPFGRGEDSDGLD